MIKQARLQLVINVSSVVQRVKIDLLSTTLASHVTTAMAATRFIATYAGKLKDHIVEAL